MRISLSEVLQAVGHMRDRLRHRPPGWMFDTIGDRLHPDWQTTRFRDMIREAQDDWYELEDEVSRRRLARRLRKEIFLRASKLVFLRVSVEALLALCVAGIAVIAGVFFNRP